MWLKVMLALFAFLLIGIPILGFFSLRFLRVLTMAGLALAGIFILLLPVVLAFGAITCLGMFSRSV